MMINIMEAIEKEDRRKNKIPFIDYVLWKRTLEGMIDTRIDQYPTLDICLGCSERCRQVQVEGLERLYCGIKKKEWQP